MDNKIMCNIPALLTLTGKKKGDLDHALGHSNGYLSSKTAEDLTWAQMNIIADFFAVSVNDLITFDYSLEAEIEGLKQEEAELKKRLSEIDERLAEIGA